MKREFKRTITTEYKGKPVQCEAFLGSDEVKGELTDANANQPCQRRAAYVIHRPSGIVAKNCLWHTDQRVGIGVIGRGAK